MNIKYQSNKNQLNQFEMASNNDLNNIDLNQCELYKIVPNENSIYLFFFFIL